MKFLFFGELMLRLTPARYGDRLESADFLRMTPGGSEANTAVALKSLSDHDVTYLSSFPDNPLGKHCINALRSFGVRPLLIASAAQRMGLYWLDMGNGPRASEVYYDRADSAFNFIETTAISKEDLLCDWFHTSGITPAISQRTCQTLSRILELLQSGVSFSMDLNYRGKLWQWADKRKTRQVYDALCKRVVLLTGNENDFQNCLNLTGKGSLPEEIYLEIAEKAFSRYHRLRFLAVSLRQSKSATINEWSGMLFIRTADGYKKFIGPHMVIDSVIDRLGTGDCFTAGIIHGLNTFGDNYQKTINFAVMLSALKHSVYGDFASFTQDEVLKKLKDGGSVVIER